MQLSPIMNLIGAVLIVGSIVVHIVCLATPHYFGVDSDAIKDKLQNKVKQANPDQMDIISKNIEDAGLLMTANMHAGLWKICIYAKVKIMTMDFCAKWASETVFKTDMSQPVESFKVPAWIQGAQAMAILGLLVSVAAIVMAAIHLFVPSRGDRLRMLPVFICIGCFVAGAFILCGDIIVAAKYSKVVEDLEDPNENPPQMVVDIIEESFYLSWGFALDIVASALILLSGLFFILGGRAAMEGGLV